MEEFLQRRMSLLRLKTHENPHRRVDKIVGGLQPWDEKFPWKKLRGYIDSVLTKEYDVRSSDALDKYLLNFVHDHKQEDVALAACCHAMSKKAIIKLVLHYLHSETFSSEQARMTATVQILSIINHAKPEIVSVEEIQRAENISSLISLESDLPRAFRRILKLFSQGFPNQSLLAGYFQDFSEETFNTFSTHLEGFRKASNWIDAHNICPVLQNIPTTLKKAQTNTDCLSLVELLDGSFFGWKQWVEWNPDKDALHLMSQIPIVTKLQREVLVNILTMEDPFTAEAEPVVNPGDSDLKSRTFLKLGKLGFSLQRSEANYVTYITQQLKMMTRKALQLDGSICHCRIDLIRYLCVHQPITEPTMEVLAATISIEDDSIIEAILTTLIHQRSNLEPPIRQISKVLSFSETGMGQDLRKILGSYLIQVLEKALGSKQMQLKGLVTTGNLLTLANFKFLEELHEIGSQLRVTTLAQHPLHPDLISVLDYWPATSEMKAYQAILLRLQQSSNQSSYDLSSRIEIYLIHRLVEKSVISDKFIVIQSLVDLWRAHSCEDRRVIAIIIARSGDHSDAVIRSECIQQLFHIDGPVAKELRYFVESYTSTPVPVCVSFAKLLISQPKLIQYWRIPLLKMIQQTGDGVITRALESFNVKSWTMWLDDIATIFADYISNSENLFTQNRLLTPSIHRWCHILSSHMPTIQRLENEITITERSALSCILGGGSAERESDLESILEYLGCNYDDERWKVLIHLAARLKDDTENVKTVLETMLGLEFTTPVGLEASLHVLTAYTSASWEVAETMLHCWMQEDCLTLDDHRTLKSIASVLHLDLPSQTPALDTNLYVTKDHLMDRYRALLTEAQRLEDLRISYQHIDRETLATLLEDLGIENGSSYDYLFLDLPNELLNVTERISDAEFEFQISLDKLTALQRRAMGSETANSLLVRLSLGFGGTLAGFCMHFDAEYKTWENETGHSPCLVFAGNAQPEEHQCHGRPSIAVYQLSRVLSSQISQNGITSLTEIYNLLVSELNLMGSKCVVCNAINGSTIRRSTTCNSPSCLNIFENSNLEVRLSGIYFDLEMADLLFAMVYANCLSNTLSLLPNFPIANTQTVKAMLQSLSSNEALSCLAWNQGVLFRPPPDTVAILEVLSWLCSSYRGYLTSATGTLKIPSFPGSYQFCLVNSAPELEAKFSGHVSSFGNKTQVVFHGTTMDRLYSILREGLRDMSGTNLMRNGQSFGKGIYVSSEPSVAWGYSTPGGQSWLGSRFSNFKVLLGCELTGNWQPTRGNNIYVITNPSCIMVRYIFMLPNAAQIPIARHVTPAMDSIFTNLRRGML